MHLRDRELFCEAKFVSVLFDLASKIPELELEQILSQRIKMFHIKMNLNFAILVLVSVLCLLLQNYYK